MVEEGIHLQNKYKNYDGDLHIDNKSEYKEFSILNETLSGYSQAITFTT